MSKELIQYWSADQVLTPESDQHFCNRLRLHIIFVRSPIPEFTTYRNLGSHKTHREWYFKITLITNEPQHGKTCPNDIDDVIGIAALKWPQWFCHVFTGSWKQVMLFQGLNSRQNWWGFLVTERKYPRVALLLREWKVAVWYFSMVVKA